MGQAGSLGGSPNPSCSGVLLVDKPEGPTSHDVVRRVRRVLGQRAVGHTGTLDPMASGLLVLTLGRATRISRFMEAHDKSYTARIMLGRATTTLDREGEATEVCAEGALSGFTEADVLQVIAGLHGDIEQEVPAFSAVKVGGERLYARARRGAPVKLPVRTVHIEKLELTRFELPYIDVVARVSKGTYIRSLAVQLGRGLGVPAHLAALRRQEVGPHSVDDACALDDLKEAQPMGIRDSLNHFPSIQLGAQEAVDVSHGRPLRLHQIRDLPCKGDLQFEKPVVLVAPGGEVVAVARYEVDPQTLENTEAGTRAVSYLCVLSQSI